jgi:hypothetical protein
MRARALAVGATFSVLVALVVVYFVYFLTAGPTPISAVDSGGTAQLTLQTVTTRSRIG